MFPQVNHGRFTIELLFVKRYAGGMSPGQSAETRLTLGESSPGLILPNDSFINDTGGAWVFVVSARRRFGPAPRHSPGRRNNRQVEVSRASKPASASSFPTTARSARSNACKSPGSRGVMLKFVNTTKKFIGGEVITTALNNINLEIRAGEYVAVMGPSGCGKTTLLSIIGMLDTPDGGEYWFDGKNVEQYVV